MTNVERLAIAILSIGTITVLCDRNLLTEYAAEKPNANEATADFDSIDCPNAELQSINHPTIVTPLNQGIKGLPCDAVPEKPDPNPRNSPPFFVSLQRGFDFYSWLTFVALNSPASGEPIGKDMPTIWETWKQLPDVMLPEGTAPQPWLIPNHREVPQACEEEFQKDKGAMVIHMEMEETYNQPFKTGPLFDQNGNYALFVIFMNRQMFQYIFDNNLFSQPGQKRFHKEINFPSGNNNSKTGKGKLGSIMIKTAWKILRPNEDFSKYHVIDGLLYIPRPQPSCRVVKLGMIGFHVGHKTVTRQQWIWTTFEQHNNVPTLSEVNDKSAGKHSYSFFDSTRLDFPRNETPAGPWDPDRLNPPWVPFEHPSTFKSQIVRMGPSPVFDDVKVLNDAFHNLLHGTVWENYDLITTQWPSGFPCSKLQHPGTLPDPTCAPFPTFLANTTLETFSQRDDSAGVPLASSSCISCHNNATTHDIPATRSDFTYILEKAQDTSLGDKK